MASMYAVYHGPEGLDAHRAARAPPRRAAARRPRARSASPCRPRAFFDTLTVATGERTARDRRARASRRLQPAPRRRRARSASRSTRPRRAADVERDLAVFAGGARGARDRRPRSRGRADALPPALRAHLGVPHAPGVPPPPLRDRDAALPAPPRRPGPRARPLDDPARLVHDEAQRDDRDDPGHVARVRRAASVRAGRAGARLSRADRRPRGACCAPSPATPRCRCSRTPARRASTRAC